MYQQLLNIIENNVEELQLPISVQRSKEVLPKILEKLNWYQNFIDNSLPSKSGTAKAILNRIYEAIDYSLQGKSKRAMEMISWVLEDYKKLGDKIVVQSFNETLLLEKDGNRRLFKARVGDNYGFQADEMFHIPFDSRELVRNQRYSISGMPCLYIGTSAYVCWEELGRPEPQEFWVSRLECISKDLKVLNLSYTIQEIRELMNDGTMSKEKKNEFLENYLLSWVLQCVCSISVNDKVGSFRVEYIIPQLIMSCIKEKGIDGVVYFSVKGDYLNKHSYMIMKNYAFPADDYRLDSEQESEKSNLSLSINLMKSFSISRPLNLGFIGSVYREGIENEYVVNYLNQAKSVNKKPLSESGYMRMKSQLNISHHHLVTYDKTKFFQLEKLLRTSFPSSLIQE